MVNEYLWLPVITVQLSCFFVAIASGLFIISKGSTAKIAPHCRQLSAVWFTIALSLAAISLVNLIVKVTGIALENLILWIISVSIIVGILTIAFQLIRQSAPQPRS